MCKPNMSFNWLCRISPSLSFPHPLGLLPSTEEKRVCRMFCSEGPLLHQYSQARASLGAYVVKKRNHVDDKDKDGRKVKQYIRGNLCQVQSAWKLSLPWRADESPGPSLLSTQLWGWASVNKVTGLFVASWRMKDSRLILKTQIISIYKILWKVFCYC